jgi:GNAT superfamily N-acetyltransferase
MPESPAITFKPLTPSRWKDFETLFGDNGACGGCWCMSWRWTSKEFQQKKGALARRTMKKLVDAGPPPGLLAYAGRDPIGWVSISPRKHFIRLQNSKVLSPIDDQPVWSATCFFVRKDFRRRGLTSQLLKAAAEFARKRGAKIVEGYPYDVDKPQAPPFVWTGLVGSFTKAGFQEAARRSKTRPIMRLPL